MGNALGAPSRSTSESRGYAVMDTHLGYDMPLGDGGDVLTDGPLAEYLEDLFVEGNPPRSLGVLWSPRVPERLNDVMEN